MSDDDIFTDEDEDEIEEPEVQAAEEKRKRAESRLQQTADKARSERDDARRELAFLKAGIDTETPIGKLVLKGYDGDLTVEAIKAYAIDVGALAGEAPPPEPEITTEEKASTDERASLANGAEANPLETPPPTADDVFQAAMAQGATETSALALAIRAQAENKDNWVRG